MKTSKVAVISVLALIFWSAPESFAQAPGRAPTPPRGTAGHSEAGRRQAEAATRERAAEKAGQPRGKNSDRGETEPPPTPPEVETPSRLSAALSSRTPLSPARQAEFLQTVAAKVARVRTETFDADVMILNDEGIRRRWHVLYSALRPTKEEIRHRVVLHEIFGSEERRKDILLLHETPGLRPKTWHLGAGDKPEAYESTDGLLYPLGGGVAFTLVDLLPFDLRRYTIQRAFETTLDREPALILLATSTFARTENVEIAYQRFNPFVLRTQGWLDATRLWETLGSDFKTLTGLRLPMRLRHFIGRGEEQVIIRFASRTINDPLEASRFAPETFHH